MKYLWMNKILKNLNAFKEGIINIKGKIKQINKKMD